MSRRTDAVLIVVVGALATFVGAQVVSRKPAPKLVAADPAPTTAAKSSPGALAAKSPRATTVAQASAPPVTTNEPAPARDLAAINARIAGTPGTYMPAMLVDLGQTLVRWPDRREDGLRIWVQIGNQVHDWSSEYAQMARNSFADWGSAGDGLGVPIRLDFVLDSAGADIRILWTERFPPDMGQRVGSTVRVTDKNGWIKSAEITVAIHDSAGRLIPAKLLPGVVRHEAGHALGLGHSNDPNTKMYPTEVVSDIRPADRATLRLLYSLPPGPIR